MREGLNRSHDTWPDRFFEEELPGGPVEGSLISRQTIDKVLDEYYEARGWDLSTGGPTLETLGRLGIGDLAQGGFGAGHERRD